MYTVFLLGNIASGKSSVARLLEDRGALRIDLDAWAKDLYQPGSAVVAEIAEEFGFDVLDEAGGIRPAVLAARAFAAPEATARLNAIVHPRLVEQLSRTLLPPVCCAASVPEHALAVVEVSAPSGFREAFGLADEVMVVSAPIEVRRERARMRGMSYEDFDRRAEVQPSDGELAAMGTFVIDNTGSREDLERALDEWLSARGLGEGASAPRSGEVE